jgi:CRP/FNR family cyclic AMP-dependent transcriptional regulator
VIAVDIFGLLAGALGLTASSLKTMIPLRSLAIASNMAFIVYGVMASAFPITVLHLALLPVNAIRLNQILSLTRKVKHAPIGKSCIDALVPYMRMRKLPAGTILFNEGDCAKEVHLILEGCILIAGEKVLVETVQLVGEMGIFAPGSKHPYSVECESEVTLASIDDDKIWELFYQNPESGVYFLRLIMSRCYMYGIKLDYPHFNQYIKSVTLSRATY